MNFLKFLLGILSILALALADKTTTSTSVSKTTVYHTATVNGVAQTTKSIFTQTFMVTYTSAITSDLKSGSIGLGTISGQVGQVRTYDKSTINGGNNLTKTENIYAGLLGLFVFLFGCLL